MEYNKLTFNLTHNEKKLLINLISLHLTPIERIPSGIKPQISPLRGIKGIIFDIYGTIFVSGSGDIGISNKTKRNQFFCDALKTAGIVINNDTACETGLDYFYQRIAFHHNHSRKNGIPNPEVNIFEIWAETLHELSSNDMIGKVLSRIEILKIAVLFEIFSNPVSLMPGISKFLLYLKQNGIPAGIVSNAQFYTPLMFEVLFKQDMGDIGFCSDLIYFSYVTKNAKPSLFMFEKLKKQLYTEYDLSSRNILYIGNDMLNDISTASKCGFRTALFAGDLRSLRLREDIVQNVVPDVIITEFEQLKEILLT